MLMAEAPNIIAFIATVFFQTICFSIIQLYLFKQQISFNTTHCSNKHANNCHNQSRQQLVHEKFKHHKIKKKSGNMKTTHAEMLPGLTTLSHKADCWVPFHLHHLFVLPPNFFKSLWLMPLVPLTYHAGASCIFVASTGLLLRSIATSHFRSCNQAQSSEGDSVEIDKSTKWEDSPGLPQNSIILQDHGLLPTHLHVMTKLIFVQTYQALQAFQQLETNRGVITPRYHRSNEGFTDNTFRQYAGQQTMPHYGSNAHFFHDIAKQGTRELMGSFSKQLLHTTANFIQAVFLTKFKAMRSPGWQILVGRERPHHVPSEEQILHVPNRACAPIQNVSLLPEQDYSINFPRKLSFVNFNEDDFLILQKCADVMKNIFILASQTSLQGTENEGVTRSNTVCITTRIHYKVLEAIRDYAKQF